MSGALLHMAEGLPSGEQMLLTFLIGEQRLCCTARVCYVGRVAEGFRVGVQLNPQDHKVAAEWQSFCASLHSAAEERGDQVRSEAYVVALASALPSSALASLLESGCRVSLATDASAALRTLNRGGVEVLICDVKRPDLDGRALCELVRRKRSLSGVHVILLAGRGDVGDPARGLDVGATYVFTQPVDPEQLISVIALCQRS
jgi:CheY-like chemotaxis protein